MTKFTPTETIQLDEVIVNTEKFVSLTFKAHSSPDFRYTFFLLSTEKCISFAADSTFISLSLVVFVHQN